MTHEPVTAVQLSRGKAEAQLLFEITLLTQDMDVSLRTSCCFTRRSSASWFCRMHSPPVHRSCHEAQSGCLRADAGPERLAQAALTKCSALRKNRIRATNAIRSCSKAPLFRAIDSCQQTLDILPDALAGVRFRPDHIRLDPSIHAAAAANALVAKENIPFREAYRRVAAILKASK